MKREDAEQIGKTQSLFRELNERIVETADAFQADEAPVVCECADAECMERLETPIEEYERVRGESTHFLLKPGHADDRVERPVRSRRGFQVVEKFERTVVATVRLLDPRAGAA
jgi:hypothetical protein